MRFRRSYQFTPALLTILLGLQHCCAALSAVLIPIFTIKTFFEFFTEGLSKQLGIPAELVIGPGFNHYLLQAGVIIAGICTIVNSLELRVRGLPYQFGTGLTSIVTNSAAFTPVFCGCMYKLITEHHHTIHDAYGKLLGTASVVSLVYIAITLIPRKYVKRLFPPVVCGLTIILLGLEMMIGSIQLWGGGIGCANPRDPKALCKLNGDVELPFGSAEYLGLGFFVVVLFIIYELIGSPFTRHNILSLSVLIVYGFSVFLTKDGKYYVNGHYMDDTPAFAFLWTTTYKLGVYKGALMPLLGAFLVTYLESTAVFTATLEESRIDLNEAEADRRIQGGLISTAIGSFFSVLATGMPVAPAVLNNSLIGFTGQSSYTVGIATGFWLIFFGIVGKIFAVYLEIPGCIKGATGVLIYAGVIWNGFKILSKLKWDRRMKLIALFSFGAGLTKILVRGFITNEHLWPSDDDMSDFLTTFRYTVLCMLNVRLFY